MSFIIFAGVLITLITMIPVLLQIKSQPKGLFVCFFAEMWERFSYYGMRALLVFYMTQHFLFDDARAAGNYGAYTTLVYLLPLLGGIVADRFIGTRKAVLFGGLLLVFGHFGMGIEGKPNQDILVHQGAQYEFVATGREADREVKLMVSGKAHEFSFDKEGGIKIEGLSPNAPLPAELNKSEFTRIVQSDTPWAEMVFYFSLAFIILGVGFLKPNISALVGQLYEANDPRRDPGFQLYYFGINLGAFWAAILCGYMGVNYGWWAGFGLAGLGMLAGLLWFALGKKWLEGRGEPPEPEKLTEKVAGFITKEHLIYLTSLIALPLAFYLVQDKLLVKQLLLVATLIILGYIVFQMVTKFTKVENYRLGLAMILTLGSVIFWSLFEQAGSSLSLFASRNTDLQIMPAPFAFDALGYHFLFASKEQLAAMVAPANTLWVEMGITASNTQSFNPFFILIMAPIMAAVFTFLSRKNMDPDPVKKFAFALVMAGIGFLVLVWGAPLADSSFRLPLVFLLMTYLFHTIGELALSPVGLSQITRLSPKVLIATMMSVWFLGTAGGQSLAAFFASQAATETVGGQVLDAGASLAQSIDTFEKIGIAGIAMGLVFFVLSFIVGKWTFDDKAS